MLGFHYKTKWEFIKIGIGNNQNGESKELQMRTSIRNHWVQMAEAQTWGTIGHTNDWSIDMF
jgi:hypothetical protein